MSYAYDGISEEKCRPLLKYLGFPKKNCDPPDSVDNFLRNLKWPPVFENNL